MPDPAGGDAASVRLVVRSEHAGWLAVPWELVVDPAVSSRVVLDALAVSRRAAV